jgi:hypothetical protein
MSDYSFAGFSKYDHAPEILKGLKEDILDGKYPPITEDEENPGILVPGDLEIRVKNLGDKSKVGLELQILDPDNQKPLIHFGRYQIEIDGGALILADTPPWPVTMK